MNAKYTPGPWVLSNSTPSGRFIGSAPDGVLGIAIAFGDTPTEQDANANLIAAAPDLLAACYASLQWMRDASETQPIRMLQDAINKAEGRS